MAALTTKPPGQLGGCFFALRWSRHRKDLSKPLSAKNRIGLSVEISDNRFHGCNSLLNRGNFGNLLFRYRTRASSHQRDNQIATLFFELNKGQSMIFKIRGHCRYFIFRETSAYPLKLSCKIIQILRDDGDVCGLPSAGSRRRVFLWAIPGESVAGTIAEMSALFLGPGPTKRRGSAPGSPVIWHRTMHVSGLFQRLFLIAWATLSAIATIGWLYFIAMSFFQFIIDLL
jgi:hypothetical protein